MVGLQSAIREQRRDRKYITSDYVEVEPNVSVYEVDQFSTKSGRLSPSFAESEDFDVINEWIREPDCSEMVPNTETNQGSQEDFSGRIHDIGTNTNNSMEDGGNTIVANVAESESRGVVDTQEMKPICEEFGQGSAKLEGPPNEVENVEVKFGMVCLGGHAIGNDEDILSQKPPTDCATEEGTIFPIHNQSGATSSNGVSGISVDNAGIRLEPREESIEYISSAQIKEDSKEVRAKNPSFSEELESKVPKREEKVKLPKCEESEAESGEIISEDDGRDCIRMVESDSDYSSGSSSSDDEDKEEGEIRSSNGRRISRADSLDEMLGSSDEEGTKEGPIRSLHELQVLPPVPPVNVVLEHHHQTLPLGTVSSVLGAFVLVEGIECHNALNEGTILWITEKRLPLGVIDEVFGPVKKPYYVVRFNTAADVPDCVREGAKVSYVSEFANYVRNDPSLYKKGYDASGDHDEELSEGEIEFSDDEKEAQYKLARAKTKRGANPRENMQGRDYGRTGKNHRFVDKRRNKGRGGRSEDGNSADGLKGEAQEMRFTSKKPFRNSSRGWNSSMAAMQSKDRSKPQGPAPPCMPPPVQSVDSHQTSINDGIQQSPQHFDPTSGSLSRVAVPVAYSGTPTQSPSKLAGASSWGIWNSTPTSDTPGGLLQVQYPVVGGQSAGRFNMYPPGFLLSRLLNDKAGGIPIGHPPTGPLHDPAGGIRPGQPHSRPFHDPVGGIHMGQPHSRPLHDPAGGAHLAQPHSGPLHDQVRGIQLRQANSRPFIQDMAIGIPVAQPNSKPLHDPTGVIPLGQPSAFGGLMLNGNQMNTNPLGLHQRPMHSLYVGSPLNDNSIHPRIPLPGATWNAGSSNHLAEGAQLQLSDSNQGIRNPLHYNQTQPCFGTPLSHHPGRFPPLYANMGMTNFCNSGSFPGQNILSCPMPWGQFASIIQGNPNQQYQNCGPLDGGSAPISQPNSTMSVNAPRPPLPPGPPPQGANLRHW